MVLEPEIFITSFHGILVHVINKNQKILSDVLVKLHPFL